MQNIAIINNSTKISNTELERAVKAIQIQVSKHLAPIWAKDGKLRITKSPQYGDYLVFVADTIEQKGVDGWHTVRNGVPIAEISYNSDWTYTLSHEIIEMLHNPYIIETKQNDLVYLMEEIADATNKVGYEIDGIRV